MTKLNYSKAVTLVGGGPVSKSLLHKSMALAPIVIAADAGANHLYRLQIIPQAIIGDLDSLKYRDYWRSLLRERLIEIADQNMGDFEKSLRCIEAPQIIAVGFAGGRFDHLLAALAMLRRYSATRVYITGTRDIVFLVPHKKLHLPLGKNCRISFVAIESVTVRYCRGLRWSLEGMQLAFGQSESLANLTTETDVELEFNRANSVYAIIPLNRFFNLFARGALP